MRICLCFIAGTILFSLGGCQDRLQDDPRYATPLPAPIKPPAPTAQENDPATQPVEPRIRPGSPEALTMRTRSWVDEVEKHGIGKPAENLHPLATRPTTRRSDPEPTVVPLPNPINQSTASTANQGVSLAPSPAAPEHHASNTPSKELPDIPSPQKASASLPPLGSSVYEQSILKNYRDNPRDLASIIDYQFLQLVQDKPTPQMDVLARLQADEREFVSALFDGIVNAREAMRADRNMLSWRRVKPFLDMADRMRAQADMVIPTVALCRSVSGFGVYEPMDPPRFTAMRENEFIVYCEVENFASQLNDKRLWETKLSQEVVLYTETGLPVWQDKTPKIFDTARRRRHDFFIVKKTKFPSTITIGRYMLKVTLTDQQANRVAEATIPVQFVAN